MYRKGQKLRRVVGAIMFFVGVFMVLLGLARVFGQTKDEQEFPPIRIRESYPNDAPICAERKPDQFRCVFVSDVRGLIESRGLTLERLRASRIKGD